jgi:hypothetical protein
MGGGMRIGLPASELPLLAPLRPPFGAQPRAVDLLALRSDVVECDANAIVTVSFTSSTG